MKEQQLIFVYNAHNDLFSTVTDFAHKLLSPATYSCNLCTLTYGNFTVKQEWKSFTERLPIKAVFLYKDEFEKQYKIQSPLPAVFIGMDGIVKVLISKQEIESCKSLGELIELVNQKIQTNVQHHHSGI